MQLHVRPGSSSNAGQPTPGRSLPPQRAAWALRASAYEGELRQTAQYIAKRGKGILASDESNATTGDPPRSTAGCCRACACHGRAVQGLRLPVRAPAVRARSLHTQLAAAGKRLDSIGVDNTETNRLAPLPWGCSRAHHGCSPHGAGGTGGSCCTQRRAWASTSQARTAVPDALLQLQRLCLHRTIAAADPRPCASRPACAGAIMFEETLYQSTEDGKPFVKILQDAGAPRL